MSSGCAILALHMTTPDTASGLPHQFTPDDLIQPHVLIDPYPAYRALRDASPARYVRLPAGLIPGIDGPVRSWAVLRHSDVLTVLRDPETFSSNLQGAMPFIPRYPLQQDDPPAHTHLRKLVNKAFSPRHVTALVPAITSAAHLLLDAIAPGPVEIMGAYAAVLPMQVITGMLGVPAADYTAFRRWSEASVSYNGMPPQERQQRMKEMVSYLGEVLGARRQARQNDLISALLDAESDGASLDEGTVLGLCVTLFVAGNETTMNLIGNMLHVLAERPALWQEARAHRELVDRIIEETLRFVSPVQRIPRVARRAVVLGGTAIAAGDIVDVFLGAANRDPAVFEDPDTFRLDRTDDQHIAFGSGIHTCFGAPLTRTEVRITLEAFLDRFTAIRLGDEPARRQRKALLSLGFERLPLVLEAQ